MNSINVTPLAAGSVASNLKKEIDIKNLKELQDDEDLQENEGMFRILHQDHGDKRIVWDRLNITSVKEAKDLYLELIEEGFVPYRVDGSGNPTEIPMSEFDASAEEVFMEERQIIMAPVQQAVGG